MLWILFRFKSEAKISDFQANYELYYEFWFGFKSEAKFSDFQANHELYYEFLFGFKSEAKISDFQANFELYYEFLFGFKSEAKISDFQANHELCYESYLDLKVRQKFQIFRLNMSCTMNSYLDLKVRQKISDFQANWSNLLMGVVTIFKYGKWFRFAPSFNYNSRWIGSLGNHEINREHRELSMSTDPKNLVWFDFEESKISKFIWNFRFFDFLTSSENQWVPCPLHYQVIEVSL